MKLLIKLGLFSLIFISVLLLSLVAYLEFWHKPEIKKAEQLFAAYKPQKLNNLGTTRSLSIMPLVNWHSDNINLLTELGVSYLIKTDKNTILFDLGQNTLNQSPSPLLHNMRKLNTHLSDIDTIFISHNHFDHVGGSQWSKLNSFSIDTTQVNLEGKKVFTPMPMTYPNLTVSHTPTPLKLVDAVATTGTIPRKLFMGWIDEQALAINLEGKGIVLVVGCGHQTLAKIIKRAQDIFKQPIYGVVGDLHYPVPNGRLKILNINAQRVFASGTGPFSTITQSDIQNDIQKLKSLNLGVMALGGHDSSDQVILQFEKAFDGIYQPVKVGSRIVIN